jgi:hypothetical protein
MDSRRSPQRVGDAHLADQPANFQQDSWPAASSPRFLAPIRSETGTVPTDDGIWPHNYMHQVARNSPVRECATGIVHAIDAYRGPAHIVSGLSLPFSLNLFGVVIVSDR